MKRAASYTQFNCKINKSYHPYQYDLFSSPPKKFVYLRTIPIKTVSEANRQEHWTKSNARHSTQKLAVKSFLNADAPNIQLPCTIKLTRISPRQLDSHENLPMSFKWIVDAIAEYIHPNMAAGRADDDKRIKWEYSQEKGAPKEYAIRIQVT